MLTISSIRIIKYSRSLQFINVKVIHRNNFVKFTGYRNLTSGNVDDQSNRKKFNNIIPDKEILHKLDLLRLGYLSKRRLRVKFARKFDKLEKDSKYIEMNRLNKEIPSLFRKVGNKMYNLVDLADIEKPLYEFDNNPPEVAIIGRSNVGKSSLLNSLLNYNNSFVQKANTSTKPGETKVIQLYGVRMKHLPGIITHDKTDEKFYDIKTKKSIRQMSLILADMPGYGFAYMNEIDISKTSELIRNYLLHRKNLKRVLLLIDARHGFKYKDILYFENLLNFNNINRNDTQLSNEIDSQTKHNNNENFPILKWKLQIVLTKCDLLPRQELARRMIQMSNQIESLFSKYKVITDIIPTSSFENKGIVDLQKILSSLIDTNTNTNQVINKNDKPWIDKYNSKGNINRSTNSISDINKKDVKFNINENRKVVSNKENIGISKQNSSKDNGIYDKVNIKSKNRMNTSLKSNNSSNEKVNSIDKQEVITNSSDRWKNYKIKKTTFNKSDETNSTKQIDKRNYNNKENQSFYEIGNSIRRSKDTNRIDRKKEDNIIDEDKYQNFFSLNNRNHDNNRNNRKSNIKRNNKSTNDKVNSNSTNVRPRKPRYFDFTKSRPI